MVPCTLLDAIILGPSFVLSLVQCTLLDAIILGPSFVLSLVPWTLLDAIILGPSPSLLCWHLKQVFIRARVYGLCRLQGWIRRLHIQDGDKSHRARYTQVSPIYVCMCIHVHVRAPWTGQASFLVTLGHPSDA